MSIIAVDTGGTFTDIVYVRAGALHVLKVASTPDDPAAAVLDAVRQLATPATVLTLGSTVATNALLERRGARVALITNRGFEDVVEIGRQNRPRLYALSDARPAPLVAREWRLGISGRLDYTGAEIEPLGDADVVALKAKLAQVDAIAICLLHSYANGAHEQRTAALLRDVGKPLSLSCEILPEFREYERTTTTVVNAYVAPLMASYLGRLERECPVDRVRIMGSAGGVVPVAAARREPVHTVLSGPAGGVAGALATARADGVAQIISFDMGGTSTDVSLCPGAAIHTRDFSIAGVPVAIPVLDIHTVGAGGGSIAWIDAGGALRVGPRSAGARPGPVCYGRGGHEVTVTDANVWLGRLPADAFLGGREPLDRAAIEAPLSALAARLGMTCAEAAEGIITIVNSTMEGALRVISVERGYDPIDFALVAFGGAAGLHAADLADRLGVPRILVPPHPGLLSAYGMLASPIRRSASRTVLLRSDAQAGDRIAEMLERLETAARAALREESIADADITCALWVDARYHGQSHELRVPASNWIAAFHAAHERRYGYAEENAVVEAVTLRADAMSPLPRLPRFANQADRGQRRRAECTYAGASHSVAIVPRASLGDDIVTGPAVVTEYSATTWLPPGWAARCLPSGSILLKKTADR